MFADYRRGCSLALCNGVIFIPGGKLILVIGELHIKPILGDEPLYFYDYLSLKP